MAVTVSGWYNAVQLTVTLAIQNTRVILFPLAQLSDAIGFSLDHSQDLNCFDTSGSRQGLAFDLALAGTNSLSKVVVILHTAIPAESCFHVSMPVSPSLANPYWIVGSLLKLHCCYSGRNNLDNRP